ncbi:MAG: nucleotidyltransferase domain-containing protein [Deltaproteobacteria bacterium]|nr:nucleotidyltransferase domain-containing protein [Deltaproteobacteria bacterium]
MVGDSPYHELTEGQRQIYQTTAEVYQEYLENLRQALAFKGGMHWKKIRGREYLYRYRDRFGHGESLGPRSEHTERLFRDFSRERQEIADRLRDLRFRLAEQARFCRAALIHRMPRTACLILRRLEQHSPGRNLLVIGATAIYAYEFAAGVFLKNWWGGPPCPPNSPHRRNKESFQRESGAPDLLADAHRRLILAGEGKISWEELLRVLQQADRSFAALPGEGCRAVNQDGFLVCLAKSEIRRPGRTKAVMVPGAREPLPPEAGHLQYLLNSPRFSQVVIGRDGRPATLVTPDPWAFALNKLWWSGQEDREPKARARDRSQALAVAGLVLRYLPQYDFSTSELDMFPQELKPDTEEIEEMGSIEEF